MSDKSQTENQGTGSDLELLKAQATQLGISFHPNIKEESLLAKIKAHKPVQAAQQSQTLTVSEITELQLLRAEKAERDAKLKLAPIETSTAKKARKIREASKLVRIRVVNMNPNKRDWEGEMYSVGNEFVSFNKYVPFNNEEGWHVPQMILGHMKERKCQVFYTKKDHRGNKTRHGKLVDELSIEVMDPLTMDELKELAQRQAMARGEAA